MSFIYSLDVETTNKSVIRCVINRDRSWIRYRGQNGEVRVELLMLRSSPASVENVRKFDASAVLLSRIT